MNQGYLAPLCVSPLHLLHIHTRREFHALLHGLCFTTIACSTCSVTDEPACWNGTLNRSKIKNLPALFMMINYLEVLTLKAAYFCKLNVKL